MIEKYPWIATKRYNNHSDYAKKQFSERVQKISLDAGFTCPNRDGNKASGGCTYCNNDTFNPFYCTPKKSVTQQLEEGIAFFEPKYKTQRYLAYFQAYSNTYAPLSTLRKLYSEALAHPKVEGLVIGTRPDCVPPDVLEYIAELAKQYYVVLEYGIESTSDETLIGINRGHNFAEAQDAIRRTAALGIRCGVHMILGLPGESHEQIVEHAKKLSELPINTIKLHQLQIVKHTVMARNYAKTPTDFKLYTAEEYVELAVDFLEQLRPDIVVERFSSESPPDLIIQPRWGGLKNFHIAHKIEKRLRQRDTFQGKLFN